MGQHLSDSTKRGVGALVAEADPGQRDNLTSAQIRTSNNNRIIAPQDAAHDVKQVIGLVWLCCKVPFAMRHPLLLDPSHLGLFGP